jgi:hypothetical protein
VGCFFRDLTLRTTAFQRASKSGAQSGAHAAQNPAQQAHAPSRTDPHKTTQAPVLTGAYANLCDTMLHGANQPSGEDRTRTSAQNGAKEGPVSAGGAESGAFSGVDLELAAVIQAWAELPESVKRAVMEMVGGHSSSSSGGS